MRCIYESLALKYRYTHRALEEITGERYGAIHMIGGGTQAALLCQMTADACGVRSSPGRWKPPLWVMWPYS